jgi:hypothetical protein
MGMLRAIVLAVLVVSGPALAADAAPSGSDPESLMASLKRVPLLHAVAIDDGRFTGFLEQSRYARPAMDFAATLSGEAPSDDACRPMYVEPGTFLRISSAQLHDIALKSEPDELLPALDVFQVQMCLVAKKAGLGDEAVLGVNAYRGVLARQMVLHEYKRFAGKD